MRTRFARCEGLWCRLACSTATGRCPIGQSSQPSEDRISQVRLTAATVLALAIAFACLREHREAIFRQNSSHKIEDRQCVVKLPTCPVHRSHLFQSARNRSPHWLPHNLGTREWSSSRRSSASLQASSNVSPLSICARLAECLGHQRLHGVLTDLMNQTARVRGRLKGVDEFVEGELACSVEQRAGLAASPKHVCWLDAIDLLSGSLFGHSEGYPAQLSSRRPYSLPAVTAKSQRLGLSGELGFAPSDAAETLGGLGVAHCARSTNAEAWPSCVETLFRVSRSTSVECLVGG